MAQRSAEFAEFVAARYLALVKSAYLMTGDRGLAEDLVQSALYRTYVAWPRLAAVAVAESYTRTTMVRLAGRWSRRRSSGEVIGIASPSHPAIDDHDVGVAVDVRRALAQLPWGQRAVLVLRYFDDLSEAQTADLLHCSIGTVKSRASRGLERLRTSGLLLAEPIHKGLDHG